MTHGTLSITRQIDAPRERVYEAWTKLEHRKHWFVGPAWTEIERRVDLKVNGQELAHGRFANGTETIYTARFHLIDPNVRLIYAFDMHVGGKLFSVSLAGVEFSDKSNATDSAAPKKLTPDQQMALYEEKLKEDDWGHQPC